MFEECLRDTS